LQDKDVPQQLVEESGWVFLGFLSKAGSQRYPSEYVKETQLAVVEC
jgi:hypothetical protein